MSYLYQFSDFKNATHYWPLNYYDDKNKIEDKNSRLSAAELHNGIGLVSTQQLGRVLDLDGR